MSSDNQANSIICGLPQSAFEKIRLGHGSGGRLTSQLVNDVFLKELWTTENGEPDDAFIASVGNEKLAITTDCFVVQPITFPGGDIGSLAVHGTVNDLAMRGAKPLYITAAFILEEGFAIDELKGIVQSFARSCREAGILFVCGDTKVVNKGAGDKVFIATTGIGEVFVDCPPDCTSARPGDAVIVSGDVGLHGMSVMCARENLSLEIDVSSDSAPLYDLVTSMFATGQTIHCLRDITRGGVATILNELANSSNVGIAIKEADVPVDPQVGSACELLGLDPLYVACEGRLIAIVPPDSAPTILKAMHNHKLGSGAKVIGQVVADHPKLVTCQSSIGGKRILDKLAGEQLPRIC